MSFPHRVTSRHTSRLILSALLSLFMCASCSPAKPVQDDLYHHRAMESVFWSMPLVQFQIMRDAIVEDAGAGLNGVGYCSDLQTWNLQFATPNDTTPYIFVFWNLEDGPVVIDLPPSRDGVGIFGTLMDAWQRPLEDVGAKGRDRGDGGKYLILPPDYTG